jgi:hypothetical protein
MSAHTDRRGSKPNVLDPFAGSGCRLPEELAAYLQSCPINQALKLFQIVTGAMHTRAIFRTQHSFGDYNERLIQEFFASHRELPTLTLTAPGTWGYDATVRSGERYSLKATTTNRVELPELKANFKGQPKEKAFDYLVVGHYGERLELLKLIRMRWCDLKPYAGRRTLTIAQLEAVGELLYVTEQIRKPVSSRESEPT